MIVEIKVPSPGESISEVQIARWLKKDGDGVEKDEEIAEIDSDKATLTIAAEADGQLKILAKEGDTIPVGSVICSIDTDVKPNVENGKSKIENRKPQAESTSASQLQTSNLKSQTGKSYTAGVPSVAAKKMMEEKSVTPEQINGTGKDGRITKGDVLKNVTPELSKEEEVLNPPTHEQFHREERREKMTMLRKKVSQRLVAVKNQTAMLTTFNEVDMSNVMNIRKQYKEVFKEKHGIGLGFMSFFTKSITEALKAFPTVNAMIDGDEIVYHEYADIGIAVSAPKGLMVPVIRNAELLTFAEIEKAIESLAGKAHDSKLSIEEMTGGTFTISNGGVFGSLMSTPILNPPQSAILGMHNIVERPVAINGQIVIRPMMYVALSYDHRIIDGRESVSFLLKVKQMIEDPVKMLFNGNDPVKALLKI